MQNHFISTRSRTIPWWLYAGGALTKHLRQLGAVDVLVVSESAACIHKDERLAIGVKSHSRAWVREIFLCVNGTPVVAARSMCQFPHTLSVWKAIRSLGSRPLAHILYHQPHITRSALQATHLPSRHALARLAQTHTAPFTENYPLYARRSVFMKQNAPLLVSECFLPSFWRLLESRSKI